MRPTVTLFGDSVTQQGFEHEGSLGWVALLSSYLVRSHDVVNRGYSGYTTRQALFLLQQHQRTKTWPSLDHTAVTIVFFGANDATLPGNEQHVPVDEYARNLEEIVLPLNSRPLILVTPPAFDATAYRQGKEDLGSDNRSDQSAGRYAAACVSVGKKVGVPVIDLWNAMHKADWKPLLRDGLHLSARGNRFLFELLMEALALHVPEIQSGDLVDGPHHSALRVSSLEEDWKEHFIKPKA